MFLIWIVRFPSGTLALFLAMLVGLISGLAMFGGFLTLRTPTS